MLRVTCGSGSLRNCALSHVTLPKMETVPAVKIQDGVCGVRRAAEQMQFVVIVSSQ